MALRDQESDLKATAEDIAADAEQLKALEEEKAALDPEDPRVQELSAKGERLARRLVPKTVAEREISDTIGDPSTG
jgi:hypothetical protein